MANEYIGVSGVSRKIITKYIGVNGVSRAIKNEYIGVAGVARLCFSGIHYSIPTSLTWSYSKGSGSPSKLSNGFTVTTSSSRDSDDKAVSSSFSIPAGTVITLSGTLEGDVANPSPPSTVPTTGVTVGSATAISYGVALVNDDDGSQTNIAGGAKTVSGNQGIIPPKGSITISKSGTYHLVVSGSTTVVSVTYYSDSSGVHGSGSSTSFYMSKGTFTFSFS